MYSMQDDLKYILDFEEWQDNNTNFQSSNSLNMQCNINVISLNIRQHIIYILDIYYYTNLL